MHCPQGTSTGEPNPEASENVRERLPEGFTFREGHPVKGW